MECGFEIGDGEGKFFLLFFFLLPLLRLSTKKIAKGGLKKKKQKEIKEGTKLFSPVPRCET